MSHNEVETRLLERISNILTAPDHVNVTARNAPVTKTFVSYLAPGIPLASNALDFSDSGDPDAGHRAASFARIANGIPNGATWSANGTMLWDVYQEALENVSVSETAISPLEQKRLKEAEAKLYKVEIDEDGEELRVEKKKFQMYRRYSAEYQTALQDFNACTDNAMRSHLKTALANAWRNWGELGYRDEIDLARQTMDHITRKGLLSRREHAKNTLLTSMLNDPIYGDYLQTSVFPANALEQQSWTKVSFDGSALSESTTSSAHTVGAQAGRSWLFGLIKVAGSAGVTNAISNMTTVDDRSTISFELAQIPLIRPWFDPAILEARNWRWADGQKDRLLSDGGNPPSGELCAYASSVIIARNIEASFNLAESEKETFVNNVDACTDVQLGIFSIKGGAEGDVGRATSKANVTEYKISSPGMQVIGFVCTPLAKCPDPESGLTWMDN